MDLPRGASGSAARPPRATYDAFAATMGRPRRNGKGPAGCALGRGDAVATRAYPPGVTPVLSAGAVVIRRDAVGAVRYLLLRAYRNWDFPKGMVEPGEDPLDAALREVKEETGIADLELPWGTAYVETPPYARGKVARYYLARTGREEVDLGANPSGRREHHEARWLPYAEARPLLIDRLRAVIDWAEARVAATPPP